jgi:hypothetical protein
VKLFWAGQAAAAWAVWLFYRGRVGSALLLSLTGVILVYLSGLYERPAEAVRCKRW